MAERLVDPVERLARDDKWQLGAGDGTLFATPFPRWLDAPGFWDGARVGRCEVRPLFTVTVLDGEGLEIAARLTARRWTPAELTSQYRLGQGITATEVRTVHPGGIFVSEWRFAAFRPTRIHMVAWSAQCAERVARDSVSWDGALRFVVSAGPAATRVDPVRVGVELGCAGGATSWSAIASDGEVPGPAWDSTPFAEQWRGGALPNVARAEATGDAAVDAPAGGVWFAAVHRMLDVAYAGASATFAMRLGEEDHSVPPPEAAQSRSRPGTFGGASRKRWGEYFAALPAFRCSDPYCESLYWYRWYVMRVNAHGPSAAAANAVARVREARWSGSAVGSRDILRGFLGRPDAPVDADWGSGLEALHAIWPDSGFEGELYPGAAAAAERLAASGDREESGLFDLPPGDPSFDVRSAGAHGGGIKGVEATVRAYTLYRWLEGAALRLDADAARWRALAERTRSAVLEWMWSESNAMFSDVDARTLAQTNVKHARCFLPYRTDIVSAGHVEGLERHLFDPAEFFTAFPVPSLSADDPSFSAEGEWRGRRAGDPWNGRSHPEVNAEVVDALAHAARTHAPHLRERTATLMRRFVRMMFHEGELQRVNSREHYNPLTGHASDHRGTDDSLHPWMNDLIIRHVLGIDADDRGVTVDPLPFRLEYAEISGLTVRGRTVGVRIEGPVVTATIDGVERVGAIGTPMVFESPPPG